MYGHSPFQYQIDIQAIDRALRAHALSYRLAILNRRQVDTNLFNRIVDAGSLSMAIGYWLYFRIRGEKYWGKEDFGK